MIPEPPAAEKHCAGGESMSTKNKKNIMRINKLVIISMLVLATCLGNLYSQVWFGPNHNSTLRKGLLDYKKGKFDDALSKYNSIYNFKNIFPLYIRLGRRIMFKL